MSANGGGDADTQTGVSLLVSVDEQSLRSARADIEDALAGSVSVAVDVESPGTVAPDVERPVGEPIGAPDPPSATDTDAREPDAILPAREEQGLDPNRERRFARREHRWASSRTEDVEDLLETARDIEDAVSDDGGGGGLLGGALEGLLGDAAGAGALAGAASALTGAATALTAAAVALGGESVLDTVTDVFGDDEDVSIDDDALDELDGLEGLSTGIDTLIDEQRATTTAVENIDVDGGGGGGGGDDDGFLPDLNPPSWLTDPPTPDFDFPMPDPPGWLTDLPGLDLPFIGDDGDSDGGGGGGDITVTVEPDPLPVTPNPLPVDRTPLPVEETTLPVETPTLGVETPTLPVETPTLEVDAPPAIPLTPVPVPIEVSGLPTDPGGPRPDPPDGLPAPTPPGEDGGLVGPGIGDLSGPLGIVDTVKEAISDAREGIRDGGILGDLFGGDTPEFNEPLPTEFEETGDSTVDAGPLPGANRPPGTVGPTTRDRGPDPPRTQPIQPQPIDVTSEFDTDISLGDISVDISADFAELRDRLKTTLDEKLREQRRELDRELDRLERQIDTETDRIEREISRAANPR